MLRSAGFTLFARLITAILNFLAVILISRFLGPAERGVCGWYLVVVASTLVFSELAAGPAAGYLMRKYPAGMLRKISYAWAIVPAITITGFFLLIHKIDRQEWLLLLVLSWLNAANTIHLHVLLARQRISLFNGLTIFISALSLLSIFLVFVFFDSSATNYLAALVLSWGLAFVLALFFFRKTETAEISPVSYKALLKEGFGYGFSNQASHLSSLLNNRLVFFLLPAGILGVYSNALSLGEAMMMIPGSMGQVLYATVLSQKVPENAAKTAKTLWWLTLLGLGFCVAVIFILPDSLYEMIFGDAFVGVKSYLLILGTGLLFYGGYLVLSYWQSANGKFLSNFVATSAGLIVNIIASLVLLFYGHLNPQTGAISLSAGYLVIFLVSLFQFKGKPATAIGIFPLPGLNDLKQLLRK